MKNEYDFLARRAFLSKEDKGHDTEAAWRQVKARCNGGRRAVLRRRLWQCAVAAVVVLALGGYFLGQRWFSPEEKALPLAGTDLFKAESAAGVELLLANGQRIALEGEEAENGAEVAVEELGVRLRRGEEALQYEVAADTVREETRYNALSVPRGGEYSMRLADGTVVWLNSESTLRFPVRFAVGRREVYLEGEAYFEVAKNADAPFCVHSGGRTVTVLGTSFNISSYAADEAWAVTLVEGKVAVDAGQGERILNPSEQYAVDNRTGKHTVKEVDTELYTSWRDGKFQFKGERFEEIVQRLQRWYDFELVYEDEEVRDLLFRGVAYKHRPLEETLRNLEATFSIAFDVREKVITVKKKE